MEWVCGCDSVVVRVWSGCVAVSVVVRVWSGRVAVTVSVVVRVWSGCVAVTVSVWSLHLVTHVHAAPQGQVLVVSCRLFVGVFVPCFLAMIIHLFV